MTLDDVYEKYPSLQRVEDRNVFYMKEIKSYALRGQRLKDGQISALYDYFPKYCVEYEHEKIDFTALFGNSNPVVIEIGFGMGTSTLQIAKEHPQVNYLCLEVFLYGFSKLLENIAKEELSNIKLMRFDAVNVLENMIKPSSVTGFHIFFPDPWPKTRHHKKRLVKRPFTDLLSNALVPGGYVYCATDWEEYAYWMVSELSSTPGLVNKYDLFAPPVSWRPQTAFERKGLEANNPINEIWFEKSV